ncbi:MAG: hypothetical protein WBI53_03815 [Paludibacter sp.]
METGCRNSDSDNFWVLEPTVTTEGSNSDSGNWDELNWRILTESELRHPK